MTLFLALILDWFVGDPQKLWQKLPHPVVLIGRVIDALDGALNKRHLSGKARRDRGLIALVILVLVAILAGHGLAKMIHAFGFFGWLVEIVVVSVFLAQKSLADHVRDVALALRTSGLEGARKAVSRIVGRNPEDLDQSGIARAAIESLAENFSDGVVAPAFWYLVLGLPGIIAYKVVNTADSMIGHRSEKYLDFGRATAIFDDWINLPAARFSALLIAFASYKKNSRAGRRSVMTSTMANAGTHRSPNAGWPEAAMASSLGIALGGPRAYGDDEVNEPRLNAGGRQKLSAQDIDKALNIFTRACYAFWAFVLLFWFFLAIPLFTI